MYSQSFIKKALVVAITAGITAPVVAAANDYIIRVPLKLQFSTWGSASSVYGDWTNVGNHYDCGLWTPDPDSVDFGTGFLQSRSCNQNQTRLVTEREYDDFSGEYRNTGSHNENKVISESESQTVIGTRRDWSVIASTFTNWDDVGSAKNHAAWLPAITNQSSNFSQARNYAHGQERFEQKRSQDAVTSDIRNDGSPISRLKDDPRIENRSVLVTVSGWIDSSAHYDCAAWSPSPVTVDFGDAFVQSRDCKQNQKKTWTYKSDGSVLTTKVDDQTIAETETQNETGTRRDWMTHASTFTPWVDDGARHTFGTWTPGESSQTAGYAQSRSFKQNQIQDEQPREIDSVTGDIRDSGVVIPRNKTISGTENRTVSVSATTWVDNNSHYDCGAWSPLPATVDFGQVFTQTRSCKQNQDRNWVHKVGTATVHTRADSQVINENETQNATGSKRIWVTHASTFTDWANSGGRHTYTPWSPASSSQTTNFTQANTFKQTQTRSEQKRERDTVTGDIRNIGSLVGRTQVINGTENRTVIVSVNNWANSGSVTGCSAWSPLPSTVNYGTSFAQSRSCSQAQLRTYTHKVAGSTVHTRPDSQNITVSQNNIAIGTKQNWVSHTSTFSSWVNSGGRHTYGAWGATATSQTSNFSQVASYKQNQTQTEQKRQIDSISGQIRNTGSAIARAQTINGSESRTVTVSVNDYAYTGSNFSCGGWSPATSTVDHGTSFTQSRSCSRNQSRTWRYKVGSSSIHTRAEGRTVGTSESQNATGTKNIVTGYSYSTWSGYANSGSAYSCGGYSPSTATVNYGSSFTQSRSCSQSQVRTRTKYNVWTNGTTTVNSTESDSRVVSTSQSRSASGSKDYVASTGTNCTGWSAYSGWSPSTSSVNYGTSFTQTSSRSRSCRTQYNWAAGSTSYGSYSSSSSSRSQSATGTKDYVVNSNHKEYYYVYGSYSCGSWSPSTSTVNQGTSFTQSRSCTREKDYYYKRYNIWASGNKVLAATVKSSDGTESKTENQNATGTKVFVASSSVAGPWGAWSDSGGHYSCGSWASSTGSVCSGTSFTQSRSCKQKQNRTRQTWDVLSNGTKTNYRTMTDPSPKILTEPESRSVSGTKSCTSTWGSPSSQGSIGKAGGAPGSCFAAAEADGYPVGGNKNGTCTIGQTHIYSALTGYYGNQCQITKYKQSCN